MAKTSEAKGPENLKNPESFIFAGPRGAAHYSLEPAPAFLPDDPDLIVRQQEVSAWEAPLRGSDARKTRVGAQIYRHR
jgi:hypothetical protein